MSKEDLEEDILTLMKKTSRSDGRWRLFGMATNLLTVTVPSVVTALAIDQGIKGNVAEAAALGCGAVGSLAGGLVIGQQILTVQLGNRLLLMSLQLEAARQEVLEAIDPEFPSSPSPIVTKGFKPRLIK
jgi:hypothetical protein